MKGAEAIVRSLEKEGVKHIFGITGGAIMEVYDVMYQRGNIRHILMRHEQCAAHAAEGYARASGKVGVCMATSGPGATNLVTGIADAYMDSTPIVALTGQVPNYLIGNDAFQEADIIGITMPITKHNFQITDPDDIPEIIKAAFKIAKTRRPGPVLVDLPKDIQQRELKKKFKYPEDVELLGYKVVESGGHPVQLKEAAKAILNSERPVILAGGGVIISNAFSELLKFAEMLLIPVATTLMGKGAFPEDHPLALGMAGMHGRKAANLAITECDLLIAIGCRFSDRITGSIEHFSPESKKIHIDIDPSEIGKNVKVDIPIVGDARLVLKNLIKIIESKLKKKVTETEWHKKIEEYKKEFAPFYDYDTKPIKQQRVMKEVNKLIDNKTIITTEVGQCQMWAAHYLTIRHPRTFISSGGLGTMGFGFPAAIGAKIAKPDYKVIDIASEGSFLMTGQDLATCVIENIPVVVVILNNGYLGMVKQWQDLFYGKRRAYTYLGDIPNWEKYAKAFRAFGITVDSPDAIEDALKEAIDSGKPSVIDIHVDPDEYVLPMIRPGGKLHEMIEKDHLNLPKK